MNEFVKIFGIAVAVEWVLPKLHVELGLVDMFLQEANSFLREIMNIVVPEREILQFPREKFMINYGEIVAGKIHQLDVIVIGKIDDFWQLGDVVIRKVKVDEILRIGKLDDIHGELGEAGGGAVDGYLLIEFVQRAPAAKIPTSLIRENLLEGAI